MTAGKLRRDAERPRPAWRGRCGCLGSAMHAALLWPPTQSCPKLPFKRARFDRLLAAHALSLGVTIITNNEADFADVPELAVENWTL